MLTTVKLKACKTCGSSFSPWSSTQTVCGRTCAAKLVKTEKVAEKAKDRATRESLKTIPQLIAEAQKEFNAFIRERDRNQSCISCGTSLQKEAVGGGFDCGHYRSTGSAAHLRFDERNAHGQCKQCNRWGAGRAVDYRIGLVARIGLEAVESLESDNEPIKWDRETLRQIKVIYRAKCRELKRKEA